MSQFLRSSLAVHPLAPCPYQFRPSSWVERQSRWLPEPTLLQLISKIRILACLPSINLSLNDEDLHHAIATCSHHPLDPADCGNDFAHRLCWKIKPFAS